VTSTWRNVRDRSELLGALVLGDLKAETQEGRLGWILWLVDPALTLLSYWLVKSLFLGRHRYAPYAIFAGCAVFAWRHLAVSIKSASKALRQGDALIRSVAFPSVILPWAAVLVQFAYFAAGVVLLTLVAAMFGRPMTATLVQIPLLVALQLALVAGIATAVACGSVFVPRLDRFVSTVLRFGWYLSPGMYGIDLVERVLAPEASAGGRAWMTLYMLNPFAVLFVGYRGALFEPAWLAATHWVVLAVESAGALWLGHALYRRHERRLVKFL
jgi:ABC-type polysaccharide/polyol phosphate export permease